MTEEQKRLAENEEKFKDTVALLEFEPFLRMMDRAERDQRKILSQLGAGAGTVSPQVMAAGLAAYNTLERLVPELQKFKTLFEEGQRERAKAEIDKPPSSSQ